MWFETMRSLPDGKGAWYGRAGRRDASNNRKRTMGSKKSGGSNMGGHSSEDSFTVFAHVVIPHLGLNLRLYRSFVHVSVSLFISAWSFRLTSRGSGYNCASYHGSEGDSSLPLEHAHIPKSEPSRFSLGKIAGPGILVVDSHMHKQQHPAFGAPQVRNLTEVFVDKSIQPRDFWAAQAVKPNGGIAHVEAFLWFSKAGRISSDFQPLKCDKTVVKAQVMMLRIGRGLLADSKHKIAENGFETVIERVPKHA
ncbi:hypothetical protein B0H14DRAFT_2620115 [Mycena olivaceomarginata]|nr:hypothetical protein B0H14DRAFT_2620115 [Mycena olivaceomarginata]